MPSKLKMVRIQTKIEEMFKGLIDLSDAKSDDEKPTKFLSRAIAALSIVQKCGLDCDIASQNITDGYHDMGIDAVYNDTAQKKLFLIQSKWRSDGNGGITQEEINTFVEGVRRCLNFDFDGCNKKLQAKRQEISDAIRDMDYQIEMIFCHTGNQAANEYALRPVNDLLKSVNDDESTDLLVFTELKLQDLYDYLANGQISDNIILDDVLLSNWGIVDNPYKAYYGTIPVSAIGEWYKQYGNRLFAKNIRYYKGSTDVNQGIKDVLTNEPEKFFYYNNGIKILCQRITKKAAYSTGRDVGLFALEGVSVVNGAQTTGVIGSVYIDSPETISNARIFIQMIDIGDAGSKQAVQITKLSNTQNRIEGKDFASLDPTQERLRMELSLGGIQYLYKTGSKIDDPEHQITFDEAIISQACLCSDLSIVALVKRNIGALTENIEKTPYKALFNGATNSFSLYNGVQVYRAVENNIKIHEPTVSQRKRLVLVHGNRFLLHLVLNEIKETDGFSDKYLSTQDIGEKTAEIFATIWERVYNAMEAKFPDSYPAHIFKNVGRIKELI